MKLYRTTLLLFWIVAYSSATNVSGIPRLPDSASATIGWLLSSNDGFGHNYGTDEDNLRTFGVLHELWNESYTH